MTPNGKQLLNHIIECVNKPIFALVFRESDGNKFRYLSGATVTDHAENDQGQLALYDDVRARVEELRKNGYDVGLAAFYRFEGQSGWISLPTYIDLRAQALAKPFSPFADESLPLDSFPIDSLFKIEAAFCKAVATSYQVDVAMPACCVLGGLSTIFQHCGYVVRVRPDWTESVNLYTASTASPSEMKSPVFNDTISPIRNTVQEWNYAQRDVIEWQAKQIEILESRISNTTVALSKKKDGALESSLRQTQAELRTAKENQVKPQRWFADDATPEAFSKLLTENGECGAILSAEGGSTLGILQGRYSSGKGGGPNLDIYLKGYSAEASDTYRIGREDIHLVHPRVTFLLMCQPSLLKEFVTNDVFSGRGLCARFLYAFPKSQAGHRSFYSNPVPADVRANYEEHMKKLTHFALDWSQEETVLTVSDDALEVLRELHEEIEPTLPDLSDSMQTWIGKLKGNVVRIAALLYLSAHDGKVGEIDADTMANAVKIGRYFMSMAGYALGLSSDSPARKSAQLILKRLESPSFQQFRLDGFIRKRDLYLRLRGKDFRSVSDLDTGLRELVESGYIIVSDEVNESGKPGRPSPRVYFALDYLVSLGDR